MGGAARDAIRHVHLVKPSVSTPVGLTLASGDVQGTVSISSVAEGSLAAAAGIRAGVMVLSINGTVPSSAMHGSNLVKEAIDVDLRVRDMSVGRRSALGLGELIVLLGCNAFTIFLIVLHVGVLHPHHLQPLLGSLLASVLTALWLTLTVQGALSYWRCRLTPPGYADTAATEPPDADVPPVVCRHCLCVKPLRAHHCSRCNACVLRMDHHCFWLGTCIGTNNYGHFLQLMLYMGSANTVGAALALAAGARAPDRLRFCASWGLLALVLLFSVYQLARCVACHVLLLAHDETTIERLQRLGEPSGPSAAAAGPPVVACDPAVDPHAARIRLEEAFGTRAPRSAGVCLRRPVSAAWFGLVGLHASSATARATAERWSAF